MINGKIDTKTLHNIILLEVKRGYTDDAVLGGLNTYISRWASISEDYIKSPGLKSQFEEIIKSGSSYKEWDISKRKQWITSLNKWLDEYEKGNQKKSKKSSQTKSKRVETDDINHSVHHVLDLKITEIKGIKSSNATKFHRLGVKTIHDLIYFFPRYHIDYSQKKTISELPLNIQGDIALGPVSVSAIIWESRIVELGMRKMKATELVFGDETGNATAIWYNQPYLAKQFVTNSRVLISGKYKVFKGKIVFQSPDWDIEERGITHAGRLVPIYALTSGLYQRQVRNLVKRALTEYQSELFEYLPETIKHRQNLIDLPEAIIKAHYPDDMEQCLAARERLAFDELFLLQLGLMRRKQQWQNEQPGVPVKIDFDEINDILTKLPFQLTDSQSLVLQEIYLDMKATRPMSRLLQGDVGSGKTIIAVLAILAAIKNDYQCAFMAPTEILAEQHFQSISTLLESLGADVSKEDSTYIFKDILNRDITISLLTGKTAAKSKSNIYENVYNSKINLVIGTHALIQKGVDFHNLNLVIIDEQHRFGVMQRNTLRQKGYNPHVLVMTATPIPRTLALTLYSDLDISVISELPPGRQKIVTRWIKPEYRNRAYDFIRKQVQSGFQAFIICPLIEESENIEAKAAVEEYDSLSTDIFSDLRLGLLHGKMKSTEKEEVMRDFRDHKFDILVSTPVVEVGIDIPNATVILIEAADRFGLSQLHQFRGRVGRGKNQSYCLLLTENPSEDAIQRISSIESISDGFKLAEKDLELRGPGDFLGTRQSGLPNLVMAKLSDVRLLEKSRKEATYVSSKDPELTLVEHKKLAAELNRVWFNIAEWS
jgi:ATP-dependent DNA helicase RecG